ncbi:MAG: phosphohistidine phosphatase SixA [Magnetovibrio sp.]|nr:phosphohistidine phosphatase SixA [Magnetovibrio sp.]
MRLYLVRHGKAEFGADSDAQRRLSPRGRADVDALGAHLAQQEIPIARIVHSTLVRAGETAGILGSYLAPNLVPEEIDGIEPWGDIKAFAKMAGQWSEPTMVCGHEPFMGQAVSQLVTGNPHAGLVEVKTGTIMALSHDHYGPGWTLRWVLNPRVVRGPKTMED